MVSVAPDARPKVLSGYVLGGLSLLLAALPLLIHLAYFSAYPLYNTPVYTMLMLAWNGIPLLWLPSIGVGIATVAMKRNGRWRIAGIAAIVLPFAEVGVVIWFISQILSGI